MRLKKWENCHQLLKNYSIEQCSRFFDPVCWCNYQGIINLHFNIIVYLLFFCNGQTDTKDVNTMAKYISCACIPQESHWFIHDCITVHHCYEFQLIKEEAGLHKICWYETYSKVSKHWSCSFHIQNIMKQRCFNTTALEYMIKRSMKIERD